MPPCVAAIFKIWLATRYNMEKRFRIETEWAVRWSREFPFVKIQTTRQCVTEISYRKLKILFGNLLCAVDHKEWRDFIECLKRKEMTKPWAESCDWSLSVCCWRIAFITCFVFLYESYWTFILQLVLFHKALISSLMEDFGELCQIVWHWPDLTEGSWRFRPNWLWGWYHLK